MTIDLVRMAVRNTTHPRRFLVAERMAELRNFISADRMRSAEILDVGSTVPVKNTYTVCFIYDASHNVVAWVHSDATPSAVHAFVNRPPGRFPDPWVYPVLGPDGYWHAPQSPGSYD